MLVPVAMGGPRAVGMRMDMLVLMFVGAFHGASNTQKVSCRSSGQSISLWSFMFKLTHDREARKGIGLVLTNRSPHWPATAHLGASTGIESAPRAGGLYACG